MWAILCIPRSSVALDRGCQSKREWQDDAYLVYIFIYRCYILAF